MPVNSPCAPAAGCRRHRVHPADLAPAFARAATSARARPAPPRPGTAGAAPAKPGSARHDFVRPSGCTSSCTSRAGRRSSRCRGSTATGAGSGAAPRARSPPESRRSARARSSAGKKAAAILGRRIDAVAAPPGRLRSKISGSSSRSAGLLAAAAPSQPQPPRPVDPRRPSSCTSVTHTSRLSVELRIPAPERHAGDDAAVAARAPSAAARVAPRTTNSLKNGPAKRRRQRPSASSRAAARWARSPGWPRQVAQAVLARAGTGTR